MVVQVPGWSGVVPCGRNLLILRTVSVRFSRLVPVRRLSAMRRPLITDVTSRSGALTATIEVRPALMRELHGHRNQRHRQNTVPDECPDAEARGNGVDRSPTFLLTM